MLIEGLSSRYSGLNKVFLYGSRAKGNFKAGPDIDLTIKGDLSLSELMQIEEELDELLLPWMIDISLYSQIDNSDLCEHIDRVGVLFFENE